MQTRDISMLVAGTKLFGIIASMTTAEVVAAQGGNATATQGGATNQSKSELRMNLEQARTGLQNNDTQTAILYLNMSLSAVDGGDTTESNITSTSTSSDAGGGGNNATDTTDDAEAVSVGGIGPADDYDPTADD